MAEILIELASLPLRHPKIGDVLLNQFGPCVIVRMSLNPIDLGANVVNRRIIVDRNTPQTEDLDLTQSLQIGWSNLPRFSRDYCTKMQDAVPENDITEYAAIGIMALLINELESATIENVLPIGIGADYMISISGSPEIPIEVSGVRRDPGGEAIARVREKKQQLLKKNAFGYVSVTTFHRAEDECAHSFLYHYVKASGDFPDSTGDQ